jgi:Excalibur calcium-binding domain
MKNLAAAALFILVCWYGYTHQRQQTTIVDAAPSPVKLATDNFRCDGRTYCSQMTSCEEATYFLQHCPNTKMDGDGDGVPCEKQWCTAR